MVRGDGPRGSDRRTTLDPMSTRTALLCLLAAGCADLADPPGTTAEPIIGGTVDSGDPAVAYLSIDTTAGAFACSGTLINPRVILTAAHCLDGDGTTTAVEAYFGTTVSGSDTSFIERIDAETWGFHSGWDLSYGDVGMVLLQHDAQPTPRAIDRVSLSSHVGEAYRMVGWGQTSSSGAGAGTKRTVTASLTGFSGNYVLRYGTTTANTCQGDSGGPGFMTINGTEVVAGITSYGTNGNCTSTSGATYVYQFRNWIDNWIATNDVPHPPTASFVRPTAGASVGPFFAAEVSADDNIGVERVELYVDGVLNGTLYSRPFVFSVTPGGDGPVTLEARAYDARGDAGTATIQVTAATSCSGTGTCPDGFDCVDGACQPVQPGGLGEPCASNGDCLSGLCASSGGQGFCTQLCDPAADDCPTDYVCTPSGSSGACFPADGGGDSGGCSTGGPGAPAGGIILLAALLLMRRRRPPGPAPARRQ